MNALETVLALTVAGLAWLLYRQLHELGRLKRWASQSRLSDPPEAEGAWGDVFDLLHRHREETRVIEFFTPDYDKLVKIAEPDEARLREYYDQGKRQLPLVA